MMFTNCVLLQRQDSAFAYGTTSDLDGVFSLAGIRHRFSFFSILKRTSPPFEIPSKINVEKKSSKHPKKGQNSLSLTP